MDFEILTLCHCLFSVGLKLMSKENNDLGDARSSLVAKEFLTGRGRPWVTRLLMRDALVVAVSATNNNRKRRAKPLGPR